MKRLALLISVGLMLSACIYPIDNTEELTGFEGVAIEGYINVGAVSSFAMYPLQALSNSEEGRTTINASFTVEDDMGRSWIGTNARNGWNSDFFKAGTSFVDLTDADPSRRYRLRAVDLENNQSYISSWVDVYPACAIDSLDYVMDEDESQFVVNMSIHGNGGEGYYRLVLREDWEYKADYMQSLLYIPNDKRNPDPGEMVQNEHPNYYCWKKEVESKLNVFDTHALASDMVTMPLVKMTRSDERISYIYCLTAGVMSISEEHHDYLEHLAIVSDYNGNLFSPNPSEMRGNLRNENDTTLFVAGYIGAGTMVQERVFYENEKEFFYIPGKKDIDELESIDDTFWQRAYWEEGKRPVYYTMNEGYMWTRKRCVDCTSKGGTRKKPEFWINNHDL